LPVGGTGEQRLPHHGYQYGVPYQVKPETITAFEIGSKNSLLDKRLNLNFAAFLYQDKDMQFQAEDLIPYQGGVANIPSVQMYGLEGRDVGAAAVNLRLDSNVTWEQGRITSHFLALDNVSGIAANNAFLANPRSPTTDFIDAYSNPTDPNGLAAAASIARRRTRDVYGNAPPSLPDLIATINLSHTLALGGESSLLSRLSAQYRSDFATTIFGKTPIYTQPSYTMFNLFFDYVVAPRAGIFRSRSTTCSTGPRYRRASRTSMAARRRRCTRRRASSWSAHITSSEELMKRRELLQLGGAGTVLALCGLGSASPAPRQCSRWACALVSPSAEFGWTRQHTLGIEAIKAALGDRVEISIVDNVFQPQDAERVLRSMASSGHRLIFGTSFSHGVVIARVAPQFPGCRSTAAPARRSCRTSAVSRRATTKARTSAASPRRACRRAACSASSAAFRFRTSSGLPMHSCSGRRACRPDSTCRILFMNSWKDPGKEKDATLALIAQGCDVIAAMVDSPVAAQAAEKASTWSVGYASDVRNSRRRTC
jgi:hypothetical protein